MTAATTQLPETLLPSLAQSCQQQHYPAGCLYLVPTPIGNITDISVRALYILQLADNIACEDTRNTATLLSRYGLHKPLLAAHQHNERSVAEKIIELLRAGQRIALVSDAGMPAISDPGARLVQAVRAAGLPVQALPGPCAAVTALAASGFLAERFYFVGFLPNKASQREQVLRDYQSANANLIFYEAPHRIIETLAAMRVVFGEQRQVLLAREISKLFEELACMPLAEAEAWLSADKMRQKGEYVLVLAAPEDETDTDQHEAQRVLQILMRDLPLKQAAALAAEITGQKKNALYDLGLRLKEIDEGA